MSDSIIENTKAPRIKRAAALARKKDRAAQGRFIVEGPQAVRELLVHRPELVETLFASIGTPGKAGAAWQHEIDQLASDAGVRVERTTDAVLAAIAETVHPQGVIAVARTWQTPLAEAFEGARLAAIMHEVRDPGNAGAVLRAADAAGADAVIFAGRASTPSTRRWCGRRRDPSSTFPSQWWARSRRRPTLRARRNSPCSRPMCAVTS